jgi:hypothetical protein
MNILEAVAEVTAIITYAANDSAIYLVIEISDLVNITIEILIFKLAKLYGNSSEI